MNKTCLYFHINSYTEEVFYVGIGTKRRSRAKLGRSLWWYNTVKKFGVKVKIIHEKLSWEKACELEVYYINLFGRKDLELGTLVNLTDGGEGMHGYVCSKETAKKISDHHTGKKQTKEAIEKRVQSFKKKMKEPGYTFWSKGVAKPKEQREKMSKAAMGVKKTDDHKMALSENKKQYFKNNPHPWTGRKHTEETKAKIRAKRALQTNVVGVKKGNIPWNKGLKLKVA